MTKRQREKAERELLQQMIKDNPKLKAFLDAATDDTDHADLKAILEPVLADTFNKVRMQGIQIGWYSHAARCKAKIQGCKSLEEAIEVMDKDVREVAEKLGINPDEDEEDGTGNYG